MTICQRTRSSPTRFVSELPVPDRLAAPSLDWQTWAGDPWLKQRIKMPKRKKLYAILFSCKRLLEVLTGALGIAGIRPFFPQNSSEDMFFERLVLALMVLSSVEGYASTGTGKEFILRCKSS